MLNSRVKGLLFSILLHPATLALPMAIAIIWVVPDLFDKYTILPVYEKTIGTDSNIEHYDLDHDGNSEWYSASANTNGGSSVAIRNQKGVYFHYDFEGSFMPNCVKCLVGDADNDGIDEIYAFTVKGDSLLLNGIDYKSKGKFNVHNRFITKVKSYMGQHDFIFHAIKVTDLTGDGNKEIVFAISTGYNLAPRRVFAYDLKHDSVFSSPELGGHIGPFDIADIDGDGLDEIAVTNYGPGNLTDKTLPMQDTCAYVIVLDNNLQFLFKPIVSQGKFNGIFNSFITEQGKISLVSFCKYAGQAVGIPALKCYDAKGNLLRQREFSSDYRTENYNIVVIADSEKKNSILLYQSFGKFELFDCQLNKVLCPSILNGDAGVFQYDFDLDGTKELLFRTAKPDVWAITRNNLTYPAYFKTHVTFTIPLLFTIQHTGKNPQFCFQADSRQYVMECGFNQLYYWQYPVYLAIYAGVFFFILLVRNLQRLQQRRKTETQLKIAELQLLSIRNQLDPHFTFNALNTIESVIMQGRNKEACSLLMRFSRLLRSTLSSSESVTRSLKEEIDFTVNFLEIQKCRFRDLFEFTVQVHPEVNQGIQVPKSCIQNYAENSVKHGLAPKKCGGRIEIEISAQHEYIYISITDNGIGREQASRNPSTSTGRGNTIMRQYYNLLNRNNKTPVTEQITDLYDAERKPAGTRVVIGIPQKINLAGTKKVFN